MAFDEAQERRILIGHLRQRHRSCERAGEQRLELPANELAVAARNGIAVRIDFGVAEHLVDALDQPIGDDVFELFGLVVDLVPAHADDLHQEQLDEPVPPQDERGES